MGDRYFVSKLLEVLVCRRIARNNPVAQLKVTVNFLNPGFCWSGLAHEFMNPAVKLLMILLARSTEIGSRTLVHASVTAGDETHGKYLSDCKITSCSSLVEGKEGWTLEERVWQELAEKLEQIQPGVIRVLDT